MKTLWSGVLLAFLSTTLNFVVTQSAIAAEPTYPSRPVKLVMPFPPGGAGDILARIIAEGLAKEWQQAVIVENKAGASGMIGNEAVSKAAADGYTLLMTITQTVQAPALLKQLPYDIQKDFTPLRRIADALFLFVTTDPEITSLKKYVELAKQAPGKYSYGTYGAGTSAHIYAEMFNNMNGIKAQHIPYKGAAPLLQDMLGGHVTLSFIDMSTALPHVRSGKIQAYAAIADKRLDVLPEVPTFKELGYTGMDLVGWYGMFAPAGLPQDIAKKIRTSIDQVLATAQVQKKITDIGLFPATGTPEDFANRIAQDLAKWKRVINDAGVVID